MAAKNYRALNEMINEMEKAPQCIPMPKYRLEDLDLDTFKSSIALKNFTHRAHPQIRYLHSKLPKTFLIKNRVKAVFSQKFSCLSKRVSINYTYLTLLLWDYLFCHLPKKLVETEEPALGNPLFVKWQNRFVTEDLANSLLEFHSITSEQGSTNIKNVLEVSAGYGRLGYVFLKQCPSIKYIIVDDPHSLFIAQSYLTKIFEDKKIFKFRPFEKFEQIQGEFEEAALCFLLPHQIKLLPPRSIDLGIFTTPLHDITLDQIRYYFAEFSRLNPRLFYFKQKKRAYSIQQKIIIREADYPVPPEWEEIFWRTCPVQTTQFEALFKP